VLYSPPEGLVNLYSEIDLFALEEIKQVQADAHMQHYNGCMTVGLGVSDLCNLDSPPQASYRLVLNPLLLLNPFDWSRIVRESALSNKAEYYLGRHPCY